MKKLFTVLVCLAFLVFTGCFTPENKVPPPLKSKPEVASAHLTADNNGLLMSVSRKVRQMSAMNIYTKAGYEVVSISVSLENNTKENIPISPDFITFKAVGGTQYKYSAKLTEQITSKASFKKVNLFPNYRGGGLLLIEIKSGTNLESVTYKDSSNHEITIKFLTTANNPI
jgi:hypothetical protein